MHRPQQHRQCQTPPNPPAQQESAMLAQQIETGDGGASLVKAMIASQKANISFQAAIQVRNKVASAYKDIMNMPI